MLSLDFRGTRIKRKNTPRALAESVPTGLEHLTLCGMPNSRNQAKKSKIEGRGEERYAVRLVQDHDSLLRNSHIVVA